MSRAGETLRLAFESGHVEATVGTDGRWWFSFFTDSEGSYLSADVSEDTLRSLLAFIADKAPAMTTRTITVEALAAALPHNLVAYGKHVEADELAAFIFAALPAKPADESTLADDEDSMREWARQAADAQEVADEVLEPGHGPADLRGGADRDSTRHPLTAEPAGTGLREAAGRALCWHLPSCQSIKEHVERVGSEAQGNFLPAAEPAGATGLRKALEALVEAEIHFTESGGMKRWTEAWKQARAALAATPVGEGEG